MYFKNVLFCVAFMSVFFSGCVTQHEQVVSRAVKIPVKSPVKSLTVVPKPVVVAEPVRVVVKHSKFDELINELSDKCEVSAVDETADDNSTHIKIVDEQEYFEPYSFKLTKESKARVECIKPILASYRNLIVQVVAHSKDSISLTYNEYLASKRAISVAEMLYKNSPIGEIFAKGCAEKKSMFDYNDFDSTFMDRNIIIYLYSKIADVKDPCLINLSE